jgi:hypothetical protein
MAVAGAAVHQHRPHSKLHLWMFEKNTSARGFYEHLGGVVTKREIWTAPEGSRLLSVRYSWMDVSTLLAPV